mgnify:FL=1
MPPYQINPINDYYFRNTQPQFPPQQQPHIVTRFVTNMEEAKAAMIDGVSTNLFLDSGTGKIYLKKLNNNGLSDFLVYSIDEQKLDTKTDPIEQINIRLSNIENVLGGIANENKSVSVNDQSTVNFTTAVAEQNGTNAETEPTGFSKNAGNDYWKKRK